MKRILINAVVFLFVFSLSGVFGDQSFAAEEKKKDPVRFRVINTFQPDFVGIEKAQLIQFEMDPGAEVKDFKFTSSEILWVTKGVFTYKFGEKIVEKKAGESWFQQEGVLLDVYNRGKGVAILRGIQFLKKK